MGILENTGKSVKHKAWDKEYSLPKISGKKFVVAVAAITAIGAYNAADGDPRVTGREFGQGMVEHAETGLEYGTPVVVGAGQAGIGLVEGASDGISDNVDLNVSSPIDLNISNDGSYTVQPGDGWIDVLTSQGMTYDEALVCVNSRSLPVIHPGDRPSNPC